MSGVLQGWTGDDGPDVEADARRALTEWAALPDDLNPRDQRQAARECKRWCAAAAAWGVNPNPNPDLPRHLAAYALALLDAGYAPSSVQNALAGLDWWCRTQFTVNGTPVRVPGMTRHARLVLKAWAAEFLVVPGRGEVPVPRDWLVKMAEAMRADGSPIACRDLTMLTWGHSAGLRRGELGVIGVEDLTVDTDWIGWAFVSSKGNQTGARDDDRAAGGRTGDALCPLAARDLLRDAGWDPTLPTAPVIPAFKGGGLPDPADPTVEGISGAAVLRRLGVWAERAGVPQPDLVTPHGLGHSSVGVAPQTISASGIHPVGPFAAGEPVVITAANPANALCNVVAPALVNEPCAIVDCGPTWYEVCLPHAESRNWLFQGDGEPVAVRFLPGNLVFDARIRSYNGPDELCASAGDHQR